MPRGTPNNPREPEGRAARVPLGTPRQKLQSDQRKGHVRRWVNDTPGRLAQAKLAGYEHVLERADADGSGQYRSAIVGTNDIGGPLKAYLMEIPREFYEEDQKAKQDAIDEVDKTILRGNIRGADPKDSAEHFYKSEEGISVRTD